MTHTEAADLILRASGSAMRNYTTQATRDAILAAVATVMDAARAEALEDAAKIADGWLKSDFDESANTMCQNIRDDIRALAQSHLHKEETNEL